MSIEPARGNIRSQKIKIKQKLSLERRIFDTDVLPQGVIFTSVKEKEPYVCLNVDKEHDAPCALHSRRINLYKTGSFGKRFTFDCYGNTSGVTGKNSFQIRRKNV